MLAKIPPDQDDFSNKKNGYGTAHSHGIPIIHVACRLGTAWLQNEWRTVYPGWHLHHRAGFASETPPIIHEEDKASFCFPSLLGKGPSRECLCSHWPQQAMCHWFRAFDNAWLVGRNLFPNALCSLALVAFAFSKSFVGQHRPGMGLLLMLRSKDKVGVSLPRHTQSSNFNRRNVNERNQQDYFQDQEVWSTRQINTRIHFHIWRKWDPTDIFLKEMRLGTFLSTGQKGNCNPSTLFSSETSSGGEK